MTAATVITKKFRSASGKPLRIALTSGHVFTVTKQWRELAESLHAAAYKAGCVSDDMDAFKEVKANDVTYALANKQVVENEQLQEAITFLVEKADPEDFLKSGKVDVAALSREYGKTVSAGKRDEMWDTGKFQPVLFTEVEESE